MTYEQAIGCIESAEDRGLRAPEEAYAMTRPREYRIMPGEMFSGRWQVEAREVIGYPRGGTVGRGLWFRVFECATKEEAIEVYARLTPAAVPS